MPDVQILATANEDTPFSYLVPDAAEFVLKAVYVEFIDNGAATSWVPCLTLRSDSNHIIAQGIDEGIVIAAGDDTEVSWFPHVKRGGGSTSTGAKDVLYMIQRTPAQAVNSGVATLIEFGPTAGTNFYTNASADWSFLDTGAGNHQEVHILKQGVYLIHAALTFSAPGNYNKQLQLNAPNSMTNPIGNPNEIDRSFDTFADAMQATALVVLDEAAADAGHNHINVAGLQASGAPVNVGGASLWIARLGTSFP